MNKIEIVFFWRNKKYYLRSMIETGSFKEEELMKHVKMYKTEKL